MAQEVFKRTEKKYLLERPQYEKLLKELDKFMNKDRYFESNIMSLYYDTPDYRLIRTSMEKPVFKEKIRLRSYGVPKADSTVFLEYKRKYKGVVYKRRTFMPLSDVDTFTSGGQTEANNPQIENELRYAFRFYPELEPRMLITYHRFSYYGKEDKNLRITFDNEVTFRGYDLDLSCGVYGRTLLKSGQRLMEIKIPGAMPLWLSKLLDELKIYPTSFSKYGKAYTELMTEGKLNGKDAKDNIRPLQYAI